MNRLLSIESLALSVGIAGLLYVFGYILSPQAELVVVPFVELDALVKLTKVLFWAAAGAIIAAIAAAAGVARKDFARVLSTISMAVLVMVVTVSAVWTSVFFFAG